MKVLYVVPDGIDLGGIITSSENLMQGFREAGHTATFALLRHIPNTRPSKPGGADAANFKIGDGTGLYMHPFSGWRGKFYSTASQDSLDEFIALGNAHDVIVWGALYGLRDKERTEGRNTWLQVFSGIKRPHVAMIRDDHLPERYPWVAALEKYIVGWAGVQQASYDSLAGLTKPRALIFSGHDVRSATLGESHNKRKGKLLSLQTFKRWKKVDVLVRAAPQLNDLDITVAGAGIELAYMRSKDKCRDVYFNESGKPIWQDALDHGMKYVGVVQEQERDRLLRLSQYLVDFSSRQNSGQINRVVIEAMKMGCVPIAYPEFITGDSEIFKYGENYLPIDPFVENSIIVDKLRTYVGIKPSMYKDIQKNNYELIKIFDRKLAAQQLVDLAKGKKVGYKYDKNKQQDEALIAKGQAQFRELFGELL